MYRMLAVLLVSLSKSEDGQFSRLFLEPTTFAVQDKTLNGRKTKSIVEFQWNFNYPLLASNINLTSMTETDCIV